MNWGYIKEAMHMKRTNIFANLWYDIFDNQSSTKNIVNLGICIGVLFKLDTSKLDDDISYLGSNSNSIRYSNKLIISPSNYVNNLSSTSLD